MKKYFFRFFHHFSRREYSLSFHYLLSNYTYQNKEGGPREIFGETISLLSQHSLTLISRNVVHLYFHVSYWIISFLCTFLNFIPLVLIFSSIDSTHDSYPIAKERVINSDHYTISYAILAGKCFFSAK